jgi:alkyl hydroperoxide reductase subunit AhpF
VALIQERDRATIAQMFEENLVNPVKLVLFTIPKSLLYVPGRAACETCEDVQHLMEEIVDISDKLTLEVHDLQREPEEAQRYRVAHVPALIVEGAAQGSVRFLGAPGGYEFPTLLQDIQNASKGQTTLSDATRKAIGAISDPIHLQVFVTPT